MGLSNNDHNYRGIAASAIAENRVVTIDANGKIAVSTGANPFGVCPQPVAAGERVPVIRGGTLSGLVGFAAGARLRPQADGSLATAGTNPIIAIVKAEDTSTALICSGNLDQGL